MTEKKCFDSIKKCGILGVSQVVSQINNSSVVVHGPKGCAFPAYEASLNTPLMVSYTEMCRSVTVFGGEDNVARKIELENNINSPDMIAVITSCASEIIGDDISGAIGNAAVDVPVVAIEGGSFASNSQDGLNLAMKRITEHFCRKSSNPAEVVNIIPTIEKYVYWRNDAKCLSELLSKFGIKSRVLFCNADVKDLPCYSDAVLNVLLDKKYGISCAEYMADEFDIPYIVCDYPIGLFYTEEFVRSILKKLGRLDVESEALLTAQLRKTREAFRNGLGKVTTFKYFEELRSLKKVIIGNEATILSVLRLLTFELNDVVATVIIKTEEEDADAVRNAVLSLSPDVNVILSDDRGDIIDHLSNERYDVIIGSDVEYNAASRHYDFVYINVEYPSAREIHLVSKSYAGYDGCLNFVEYYYNSIIHYFKFL